MEYPQTRQRGVLPCAITPYGGVLHRCFATPGCDFSALSRNIGTTGRCGVRSSVYHSEKQVLQAQPLQALVLAATSTHCPEGWVQTQARLLRHPVLFVKFGDVPVVHETGLVESYDTSNPRVGP
mmetsp:Transcript_136300/g.265116  ORF Transcript_136300/g.265116 Transcript_136300/m.265116 type:complete len:124 (-) Transcript_136300:468-839(-)